VRETSILGPVEVIRSNPGGSVYQMREHLGACGGPGIQHCVHMGGKQKQCYGGQTREEMSATSTSEVRTI
jgi:hypothetical protein